MLEKSFASTLDSRIDEKTFVPLAPGFIIEDVFLTSPTCFRLLLNPKN